MPWVVTNIDSYLDGGELKTTLVYLDFEGNWFDNDIRRARIWDNEEDTASDWGRRSYISYQEALLYRAWQAKQQTRYMAQSLYHVGDDTPDGVLADLLEEDGLDQASLLLRGSE